MLTCSKAHVTFFCLVSTCVPRPIGFPDMGVPEHPPRWWRKMGGGPQANSFSVEPTQGVGSLLHLAAAEDDLSIQVPLAETILFPRSVWCHVLLCTHHACANHTPTHMHAYTTLRTYAHVHMHSGKCVIDMYRFPDTPLHTCAFTHIARMHAYTLAR